MFLEVMLMFLEVIKCSWRLYNVPGGYTNKGRYRAARAAKKHLPLPSLQCTIREPVRRKIRDYLGVFSIQGGGSPKIPKLCDLTK